MDLSSAHNPYSQNNEKEIENWVCIAFYKTMNFVLSDY